MGGISTNTVRQLRSDPDLDQDLYNQPAPPPPQAISNSLRKSNKFYVPAGKTPQQIQQEQEAAQQNYLLNLRKNRSGKY